MNEKICEYITYQQWENYAKRIERKNLREKGTSLSFSGIAMRANKHIICIEHDTNILIVKPGWRKRMKENS